MQATDYEARRMVLCTLDKDFGIKSHLHDIFKRKAKQANKTGVFIDNATTTYRFCSVQEKNLSAEGEVILILKENIWVHLK